jgi:hypothetical protein
MTPHRTQRAAKPEHAGVAKKNDNRPTGRCETELTDGFDAEKNEVP